MSAVLLAERRVIEATGADVGTLFHGLVSQSTADLSVGDAVFGALLTPQGKISADFIALRTQTGLLLDVDASVADAFVRKLTIYKLRADVRLAARPDLVVTAGEGPAPAGAFVDPRLAALGWRKATARPATDVDANVDSGWRSDIEIIRRRRGLGVPEIGADFEPDSFFLTDVNFDALNGVDYRKGCFVGQEVTSRMKRKGEIRKRALIVRYDDAAPPRASSLEAGGVLLGEILNAEGGVGLAVVRLDRLAEAQALNAPVLAAGVALRLELPSYLEEA